MSNKFDQLLKNKSCRRKIKPHKPEWRKTRLFKTILGFDTCNPLYKKNWLSSQFLPENQRKERDSNPRTLAGQRFSRPPHSTALPSFHSKCKITNISETDKIFIDLQQHTHRIATESQTIKRFVKEYCKTLRKAKSPLELEWKIQKSTSMPACQRPGLEPTGHFYDTSSTVQHYFFDTLSKK